MIVVNRNWITLIGMPLEVADALEDALPFGNLMLTYMTTFGGGLVGARQTSALVQEPPPRTLMLVGLNDRHGASSGMVSGVVELCTAASRDGFREPTPAEMITLRNALAPIEHPTARAIEAALESYQPTPIR